MFDWDKFTEELTVLINKHSLENLSNTPDFILADFIVGCISNFGYIMESRDNWHKKEK